MDVEIETQAAQFPGKKYINGIFLAVLVKSREMTGSSQILPWWPGSRRGKDDRKQNTYFLLTYS